MADRRGKCVVPRERKSARFLGINGYTQTARLRTISKGSIMDQGSLKSTIHASIEAAVDEAFIEALDGTDNPTNRNIMRVLFILSLIHI